MKKIAILISSQKELDYLLKRMTWEDEVVHPELYSILVEKDLIDKKMFFNFFASNNEKHIFESGWMNGDTVRKSKSIDYYKSDGYTIFDSPYKYMDEKLQMEFNFEKV